MNQRWIEVSVGVFFIIGFAALGWMTVRLGKMEQLGADTYPIKARFNSVAGLKERAPVQMAGVKIGDVEQIELDPVSRMALVTMNIRSTLDISTDVIASIRTNGLIGDKYIELIPGGSETILQENDEIIETESAIVLEELISKYAFGGVDE